jgi:hypothetical protein
MRALFIFLLGVSFGAGGMFVVRTYHVVRADDGFHLVPKVTAQFNDAYIDIRNFDLRSWDDHRPLAVALVKANKPQLVTQGAGESLRHAARNVLDVLDGGISH